MDIEQGDNCMHDYVRVYNGNDDQAPVIGTYCGVTVPPPITSQGSMMFVRFSSDLSLGKTGFRAVYTKSASCKLTYVIYSFGICYFEIQILSK